MTCKLNTDLTETIQIDSDGITLDGDGRTSTGSITGSGVYLPGRTGVTVKNINIKNFTNGILLDNNSINNNVSGNNASNNDGGIYLDNSSNNTLSGNNISNDIGGIFMIISYNNLIYNNYFNNTLNAVDDGNNTYRIWWRLRTFNTNRCQGSSAFTDWNDSDIRVTGSDCCK